MDKFERIRVLRKAIMTYGPEMQMTVAIEEMSELTKELCKFKRAEKNFDAIAEEIADVEIMLEQLKIIFKNESKVKTYRAFKILRLEERLEGTNNA